MREYIGGMSSKDQKEIEAKLLITAQNPAAVFDQIARRSTILNYRLLKRGRIHLRDIYLDTPDLKLKKNRLALRLRKLNKHYYLTLKGKSRLTTWGGVERLEIELPWSGKSCHRMIEILKEHRIIIESSFKISALTSPLDILKNPAFILIQDRETRRLIRYIVSKKNQRRVLAELALDTVCYHLAGVTVLQAEIELEAKAADGLDTIRQLTEYLLQQYSHDLQSWPISKLSTGILIEQLQQETDIRRFINKQHYLLPEIFSLLRKKINGIAE